MNLAQIRKATKNNIYNLLRIVDEKKFNNLIDEYNSLSNQNNALLNTIYKKNPNLNSEEYVKKTSRSFKRKKDDPKLIAFYLPQFHTIPENNEWWGKGFTEWTNVTTAQPQFFGHYQPHLPDELGFYDLSNNNVFYKQIKLAKKYGLFGFCFHYYWFSGRRLLEKPIFNYLNDDNLDFPFMLCWANEPWSRRWDGSEEDILMPQNFKDEDHIRFIEDMMPFFKDKRYIKIDNCPVLIVYRPHYIPQKSMVAAIKIWREYVKKNGFDDLYLINTRTGGFDAKPSEWGINATVEFPPNQIAPVHQKNLKILNPDFNGPIYNLAKTIEKTENLPPVDYTVYKTVFPGWDNTARKKNNGTIFYNSSPELYKKWLNNCIIQTKETHPENSQFVFINAWNEWAEGAHLEPDRKYGFAYLEATLDALEKSRETKHIYELKDHYEAKYIESDEEYNKLKKREKKAKIKNPYLYLLLKSKGNIKKFWVNKKVYNSLKDSDLFNEHYYLERYPNIQNSGMDPLLHYMYFGYKEGKHPSAKFDGNYYLKIYNDVKKAGFNPLVHYLLHGQNEGRIFKSETEDYKFLPYSTAKINGILSILDSEKISIIIYINNYNEADKCIDAILKNTKINYELILIDDFSTDDRINTLLTKLNYLENVTIIRNQEKLGFLKSVNIGFDHSQDDLILLKSNTIVTPRWLQKIVITAYSDEKIGSVTPLSNLNVGLTANVRQLKPDETAFLIENVSEHLTPEIKNLNESCIFIKRKTITEIGFFYDENNDQKKIKDFYSKMADSNLKSIIDDSTYVYHDSNDKKLNDNIESSQINEIEEIMKLKFCDLNFDAVPKKRLLYVLHEQVHGSPGGTGQTTKDLLKKMDESFECYILVSHDKNLVLWKKEENQTIQIKSWKIRSKWSAKEFYSDEFRNIYFQTIVGLKIDIVHIQHLIGHTFDLPKVANNLGIPVMLSFHDFYYVCPTIHLLDHDSRYCAGQCASQKIQCKIPTDKIFEDLPLLTEFIDTWRKEVSILIDTCDTFTAPTKSTMDIYTSIYHQLKNKPYKIIEHGRDFEKKRVKFEIPSKNRPIKILIPGTIKHHKGHDFIKELKEIDHENRIEFHFMGSIYDDLKNKGIYHGKYKREDFCKIVNKIKPSFIGIFSICPETYCHTLSEAWSCGIPVLTTKIGALEERVSENGGGWFLDPNSPSNAYNEIIRLANSKEEYKDIAQKVVNIKLKSLNEMIEEYKNLYLKLLDTEE